MRIKFISFIALIVLLIMCPSAFAQSPQVSSGIAWLNSSQTTTGNWPGVETNEYHSTAAALEAVYSLEPSNPVYTSGLQWLDSQVESPTDYLSRRIIALKRAGMDATSEIDGLLLYRNGNGSWGTTEGFDGNILNIIDTAIALQALQAANYSDTALIGQSLNYLTSNQNTDGGWGLRTSDASTAYVTSMVLRTLSSYNTIFINQTAINKASTYLLTKQNADGGFGSSPSNVYESSLVLDALIASGASNITTVVSNGIGYLTANQLSDGSWNEDPYSTALALRTLASARANLVISSGDISLSKSMPQENESVTITATVHNTGFDSATGIVVRFFLGDPSAGGTQIGVDQVISAIPVGGSSQAAITASFMGTGGKTLFVVVDPDGTISETSDNDNKSSTRIWVATAPDLAVYSEDLKPSTYVPASGTAFTLEYTIRNIGESATGAFTVSLYDGDPNAGAPAATPLQVINISGIGGTEVRTGSIGVTLTGDGSHTLYLMADSGNSIPEMSETNNIGTVTVQVGGVQKYADIVAGNITLNPSRPHAGDTVTITGTVRNQGLEDASFFTVEIFDGTPESGGSLIYSKTISATKGTEEIITTNWSIPAGIHDIYLITDRSNQINETNETNNRTSVKVMTDMVDISLSATDLSFTPSHPVNGDTVVLNITVHNQGIKDTGAFNLALYDGDPNSGGTVMQTYQIANIPGDGSTTLPYTFTAAPWTYRFYAIADTENAVTEMYEDNNQAIRSLKIKAPGEILGPDLVPVKIDLSSMTTDPLTLAVGGTAKVTYQNKGDDKITSSFNVLVFEDTDLDDRYTPGLDNVISSATNTLSLWPEGAGMVNVSLSGTVKFLHSPLYALIDSSDTILEQDETNNLLISCKDCEKRPANPIEPKLKWNWGSRGLPIPRGVRVVNLTDDNGDGKINEHDKPDLVFATTIFYGDYGRFWAVRGETGETIFTISDSVHRIDFQNATPAVGDIDGDGYPEIVLPSCCNGFVVYEHDGTFKWDNTDLLNAWNYWPKATVAGWGAPTIADVDADGTPEILMGSTAINPDGTIKWALRWWEYGKQGGGYIGSGQGIGGWHSSTVADVDLDGKQEIIIGNALLNSNGTVRWWNQSISDGANAVGNFDDDPYPEIVLVTYGRVYLLEHDGRIKWGPVDTRNLEPYVNEMYSGSAPVIADFDGDGEMEIGVRGVNYYHVLDRHGNLKRSYSTPYTWRGSFWLDASSPTVFDLNGDGRPEVLINSDAYFRIFDGKTGTRLYEEGRRGGASGSVQNNVVVADIDGDGHAELIVFGYDYYAGYGGESLWVYESKNNDWVNTRSIWNQPSYHVTNVNDDGTIPQYESPSWLMNNTYRTQARVGESPNPYLAPNLTASYMRSEQVGSYIALTVRIGNGGAKEAAAGATVTFYDGAPGTGTIIGSASTTRALQPGEYQDITFGTEALSLGRHRFYAKVDKDDAVSECNEDDNEASLDEFLGSELPDLAIEASDIVLPSGPYAEGSLIPITVNVRNAGLTSAANAAVRLYYGNPATGGTQIGTDQIIQTISAGGSGTATFTFDTLGLPGDNVLYVSVDPSNSISESNENNNNASFTLDIQTSDLPNLAITTNDILLSASSLNEGEELTVTAAVMNRGASVSNIPVKITVKGGRLEEGSGTLYTETKNIYPILSLGETATVQATFQTTGFSGQQTVLVEVDPDNSITESNENDNNAQTTAYIQSGGIASALSLDKSQYQAQSDVKIAVTVQNNNRSPWTGTGEMYIEDAANNKIAQVAALEQIDLGSNYGSPFLAGWYKRKKLVIDGAKIDGALTDFPVRMHLGNTSGIAKTDETAIFDELTIDPDDGFDGASGANVNSDRWNTASYADISNNKLRLTSTGGYKPVNSRYYLKGDFDIQADYAFDVYPGSVYGWESIFKAMDGGDNNRQVQISRRYVGSHDVAFNKLVSGSWSTVGNLYTTQTSGAYRLTRSGNAFTAYLWKDNAWLAMGSYTYNGWSSLTTVEFAANSFSSNPTIKTLFDNFKVNAGTIVYDGYRKRIAVTTADGVTQCYVEIERWDAVNKTADLWVKVPAISPGTDTALYLYYDAAHADNTTYVGDTTSTPAKGVWSPDYKAVYHMAQDPSGAAPQIKDSTSNNNNGTSQGSMAWTDLVEGKVSKGLRFDGSNDRINVPDANALDFTASFTCEVLVKMLTDYSSGYHSLLGKAADSGNPPLWKLMVYGADTGQKRFSGYIRTASGETAVGVEPYPWTANAWYHLVMTYDKAAGEMKLFLDGAQLGETSYRTGDLMTSAQPMTLGSSWWAGSWVDHSNAVLDEVRLSGIARSPEWVKANYSSQNDDLITIGDTEIINADDPAVIWTKTYTWNTGKTTAGDYRVIAEVSEEGRIVSRSTASFNIAPDKSTAVKVTTDKISYNPNETAAINSTITSLSGNYVMENLTAALGVRSEAGGGIIYSETKTITTLMPGAAYAFKSWWNTGTYAPGTYRVSLEVLTGDKVISASTASFELSASTQTGGGLSGAITAAPDPVYMGREETLTYTITNSGNEDIAGLTARIIIADPETGTINRELTRMDANINKGGALTDVQTVSTSDFQPRTYLAILQVQSSAMAQPKTLASAAFEVKPGIEVTKAIPDVTNLLVWINMERADRVGVEDHGNTVASVQNDGNTVASVQNALEEALREAVTDYRIVYDKKDFQAGMRSPYYTDYMILGDHHNLEDHYEEELREQVNAGKGIISSMFTAEHAESAEKDEGKTDFTTEDTEKNDKVKGEEKPYDPVFGVKYRGRISGKEHAITTIESPVTTDETITVTGRAERVEAFGDALIAGWMPYKEEKEGHDEKDDKHGECPAIVINQYGAGRAVYYAFDLGAALDDRNYEQLAAIIKKSIAHVHTPQDAAAFRPNQLVPVEITVKSLGAAFDARITETYPEDMKIYEPAFKIWSEPTMSASDGNTVASVQNHGNTVALVQNNPWVINIRLEPGETKTMLYYVLAPNQSGTYTLSTEAGYLEDGTYMPYRNYSTDITIDKDIAVMTDEALSALESLPAAGKDRERISHAKKRVRQAQRRTGSSEREIGKNIHDLLDAADTLMEITGADVSAIRLMLDRIIMFWEAEWHFRH